MPLRLPASRLLLTLAAVVEELVGVVAHRQVHEDHQARQGDAVADGPLEGQHDQDAEQRRGEQRAVQGAAPGGRLVEASLALLARLLAGLGAVRRLLRGRGPAAALAAGAAGAPARLDVPGLGAAVAALSLLLRLR